VILGISARSAPHGSVTDAENSEFYFSHRTRRTQLFCHIKVMTHVPASTHGRFPQDTRGFATNAFFLYLFWCYEVSIPFSRTYVCCTLVRSVQILILTCDGAAQPKRQTVSGRFAARRPRPSKHVKYNYSHPSWSSHSHVTCHINI